MSVKERYHTKWYEKRIKQNQNIKNFLIDKIMEHKESELPWTQEDLGYLNYEDLLEIAVAAVDKSVSITLGEGSDVSNGKDCKVSVVRSNSRGAAYSALITGCKNKKHVLALVYEGIQEKFYFFSFPVYLAEHTIPFDKVTGDPKRYSHGWRPTPMWNHAYPTFEKMVLA